MGDRAVTTASDAHRNGAHDLDDLQSERGRFRPGKVYATTKVLALVGPFLPSPETGARALVSLALDSGERWPNRGQALRVGCRFVSVTGQVLRVHQRIYEATDGRIGHGLIGVPSLLLRTTGRRSGGRRTNGLVYARDGGDYLVVPSNGGADRAPAWLHNLLADPEVEIQIGRDRRKGTARVIDRSSPDFDRVWRIVNENNHDRYNGYQRKTSRQIPVVAITPS